MSSISGISSATSASNNPYLASIMQSGFGQVLKDFQAVGSALQSGNMTTAQTAFTSFAKDLPAAFQSIAAQPFGNNSQANQAFQNLTTTLKSGNLVGAQTAFTSLQTQLQTMFGATAQNAAATGSTGSGSTFENIINGLLKIASN